MKKQLIILIMLFVKNFQKRFMGFGDYMYSSLSTKLRG